MKNRNGKRKRVLGESRWLLWREGVVSITVLLGHQALRNNSMEEGSGSAKVEHSLS
jgi:hypothetical protein